MTNQPAPDARPNALHRRLTVALAGASQRAQLADLLGDLDPADGTALVRAADLWAAAEGVAALRAADRAALRSRLEAAADRTRHDRDTAASQVDSLLTWQRTLRDGATWADGLVQDLTGPLGAVERARAELDARIDEHKAALQAHERVREQRHAAARAIEEADRQLSDLAPTGMDESALRRELEAAGRSVQAAREAHAAAVEHLAGLQAEATELERRLAELTGQPVPGAGEAGPDPEVVVAVLAALDDLRHAAMGVGIDSQAGALADAWADLSADLAEHSDLLARPSDAELAAARARVEEAAAAMAHLEASQPSMLTAEERAALDDAHAAVLAAEDGAERRVGGSGARKRLAEARAHEQALLERHGFGSYLDVVLSGGRLHVDEPARLVAERAHLEAVQALQRLEQAGAPTPELAYLESERERLHGHVVALLGVDPGPNTVELLRQHPSVPAAVVHALVAALRQAGVEPVGISAEAAAERFLDAHAHVLEQADEAERGADQREAEVAEVTARRSELEGEQAQAQSEVDRTAEALQMSERSVSAFEGELSVRAGEDMARMQRFAAAEQLRAQVEAVNATLATAEAEAEAKVESAAAVVVTAEAEYDTAAEIVADLARRARQLAEELPIAQRPEGDPLTTLPALADALRAHAEVLQPEVDAAEAALREVAERLDDDTAAVRLATSGDDGPEPDDLVEGLTSVLDARPDASLLVLDDPFAGVDADTRTQLLAVVLDRSEQQQVALLTEDTEVLGWAIELPVDAAMAVPADALLARVGRSRTVDLEPARHATDGPADRPLADPPAHHDPDTEPAPMAHRAGRR